MRSGTVIHQIGGAVVSGSHLYLLGHLDELINDDVADLAAAGPATAQAVRAQPSSESSPTGQQSLSERSSQRQELSEASHPEEQMKKRVMAA